MAELNVTIYSAAEFAAELGITVRSVYSKYHNGRTYPLTEFKMTDKAERWSKLFVIAYPGFKEAYEKQKSVLAGVRG